MFLMMFGYYDMVGHQRPWHTITTPCPAGDSSWLPGQTERIRNQSTKNNDLPDLLSLPPPCFTTFSLTGVYGDIPVVMIRSLRLCLVRGQMVPSTVVLYERWESAGDWTHTGPGSVTFTYTTHHSQHHSIVQCSVERCAVSVQTTGTTALHAVQPELQERETRFGSLRSNDIGWTP